MKEKRQLDIVESQTCSNTKQTKTSSNSKLIQNFFQITIHTDVYRPVQTETVGRKSHFLTMISTAHRYASVRLLKHRSKAPQHMFDHIVWVKRNVYEKVIQLPNGNAIEFCYTMTALKLSNITQSTTSAHTPELNGV